jgi:ABC-type molybdate transport system substrate-binding protein
MRTLSRALARWELMRVATATLAVVWLVLFAAFGYAATSASPDTDTLIAAAAALIIALTAILYAWREPGR